MVRSESREYFTQQDSEEDEDEDCSGSTTPTPNCNNRQSKHRHRKTGDRDKQNRDRCKQRHRQNDRCRNDRGGSGAKGAIFITPAHSTSSHKYRTPFAGSCQNSDDDDADCDNRGPSVQCGQTCCRTESRCRGQEKVKAKVKVKSRDNYDGDCEYQCDPCDLNSRRHQSRPPRRNEGISITPPVTTKTSPRSHNRRRSRSLSIHIRPICDSNRDRGQCQDIGQGQCQYQPKVKSKPRKSGCRQHADTQIDDDCRDLDWRKAQVAKSPCHSTWGPAYGPSVSNCPSNTSQDTPPPCPPPCPKRNSNSYPCQGQGQGQDDDECQNDCDTSSGTSSSSSSSSSSSCRSKRRLKKSKKKDDQPISKDRGHRNKNDINEKNRGQGQGRYCPVYQPESEPQISQNGEIRPEQVAQNLEEDRKTQNQTEKKYQPKPEPEPQTDLGNDMDIDMNMVLDKKPEVKHQRHHNHGEVYAKNLDRLREHRRAYKSNDYQFHSPRGPRTGQEHDLSPYGPQFGDSEKLKFGLAYSRDFLEKNKDVDKRQQDKKIPFSYNEDEIKQEVESGQDQDQDKGQGSKSPGQKVNENANSHDIDNVVGQEGQRAINSNSGMYDQEVHFPAIGNLPNPSEVRRMKAEADCITEDDRWDRDSNSSYDSDPRCRSRSKSKCKSRSKSKSKTKSRSGSRSNSHSRDRRHRHHGHKSHRHDEIKIEAMECNDCCVDDGYPDGKEHSHRHNHCHPLDKNDDHNNHHQHQYRKTERDKGHKVNDKNSQDDNNIADKDNKIDDLSSPTIFPFKKSPSGNLKILQNQVAFQSRQVAVLVNDPTRTRIKLKQDRFCEGGSNSNSKSRSKSRSRSRDKSKPHYHSNPDSKSKKSSNSTAGCSRSPKRPPPPPVPPFCSDEYDSPPSPCPPRCSRRPRTHNCARSPKKSKTPPKQATKCYSALTPVKPTQTPCSKKNRSRDPSREKKSGCKEPEKEASKKAQNQSNEPTPTTAAIKTTATVQQKTAEEEIEIEMSDNEVPFWESQTHNQCRSTRDFQECLHYRLRRAIHPDTKVIIGCKEFPCHSILLQAYSKYFDCIKRPSDSIQKIRLSQEIISAEDFPNLMDWILHSEECKPLVISKENVVALYSAAKCLGIPGLEEHCLSFINEKIECGDPLILQLYEEARKKRKCKELLTSLSSKLAHLFPLLYKSRQFLCLGPDEMMRLIDSDEVKIQSELDIYDAAARWLLYDWEKRRCFAIRVMKCVRFGLLSPLQLTQIRHCADASNMPDYSYIYSFPEIKEMLCDGLTYAIFKECYKTRPGELNKWIQWSKVQAPRARYNVDCNPDVFRMPARIPVDGYPTYGCDESSENTNCDANTNTNTNTTTDAGTCCSKRETKKCGENPQESKCEWKCKSKSESKSKSREKKKKNCHQSDRDEAGQPVQEHKEKRPEKRQHLTDSSPVDQEYKIKIPLDDSDSNTAVRDRDRDEDKNQSHDRNIAHKVKKEPIDKLDQDQNQNQPISSKTKPKAPKESNASPRKTGEKVCKKPNKNGTTRSRSASASPRPNTNANSNSNGGRRTCGKDKRQSFPSDHESPYTSPFSGGEKNSHGDTSEASNSYDVKDKKPQQWQQLQNQNQNQIQTQTQTRAQNQNPAAPENSVFAQMPDFQDAGFESKIQGQGQYQNQNQAVLENSIFAQMPDFEDADFQPPPLNEEQMSEVDSNANYPRKQETISIQNQNQSNLPAPTLPPKSKMPDTTTMSVRVNYDAYQNQYGEHHEQAAIIIQAHFRGHLIRRQFIQMKTAALTIQNLFRSYHESQRSVEWNEKNVKNWKNRNSIDIIRERVKCLLIPDKDVVVIFGGMNPQQELDGSNNCQSVYRFNPEENLWAEMGRMPEPRSHCGVVYDRDRVFLFGGSDPRKVTEQGRSIPSNLCWSLDPRTGKWRKLSSMLIPRANFGHCKFRGKIFVFGGKDLNGKALASCEKFDPTNGPLGEWEMIPPMQQPCMSMAVSKFGDKIFVIGGISTTSSRSKNKNSPDSEASRKPISKSVLVFEPKSNSWSQRDPLKFGRCYAQLVSHYNQLFLVGGAGKESDGDRTKSLQDVSVFEDGEWEVVGKLKRPRHGHSLVKIGKHMLILGGVSSDSMEPLDTVEIYNIETNRASSKVSSMPRKLTGMAAVVL